MSRRTALHTLSALVLSLSALTAPVAFAADAPSFESAFALFQQAGGGKTDAVDAAAEQWAALLAAHPNDPVIRAYAGGLHGDACHHHPAALEKDELRRRRHGPDRQGPGPADA